MGTLVVKLLAETGSYSAAMNTAVKVSEDTGKSLGGRLSVGAIAAGTAIGNLASKVVTLGAHLIGDGIGKIGQFVTVSTQKAM